MSLFLVTAPTVEPATLAEAKAHLRVEVNDEDALITELIKAAREHVEVFTHRALLQQTWDLKRDSFPGGENPLWLPHPPLSSVTSVTYIATDGTSTTWSSSLYTVDAPSGPHARMGLIVPAYGESYPTTRDVINAVTVRFVAGYGSAASAVPASLKQGVLFLVELAYGRLKQMNAQLSFDQVEARFLWAFKAF